MGPRKHTKETRFLEPKELNIGEMILDDQTIAYFGPRRCGKTTALYWVNYRKGLRSGQVHCPTPECYVTYKTFIPIPFIYQEFNSLMVQRLLNSQAKLANKIQDEVEKYLAELTVQAEREQATLWEQMNENLCDRSFSHNWTPEKTQSEFERMEAEFQKEVEKSDFDIQEKTARFRTKARREHAKFLIFDDLASGGSLKDPVVEFLMNNGRHYILLLSMAIQDPLKLPPRARGGLDWSFIFFESRPKVLKQLCSDFASIIGDEQMLFKYLKFAQSKDSCLAVRRNHPNPTLDNSVFLMKRRPIPNVPKMLGCPEYQRIGQLFVDKKRLLKYQENSLNTWSKKNEKRKAKQASKRKEKRKSSNDEKTSSDPTDDTDGEFATCANWQPKVKVRTQTANKIQLEERELDDLADEARKESLHMETQAVTKQHACLKDKQQEFRALTKAARKHAKEQDRYFESLAKTTTRRVEKQQ